MEALHRVLLPEGGIMNSAPQTAEISVTETNRLTPEKLQIRWKGFAPTVIIASGIALGGLYALGTRGGTQGLWMMLILGVTLGLTMTAAGMSWAGTIALAENAKKVCCLCCFPLTHSGVSSFAATFSGNRCWSSCWG